jgi:TRAP-type C4-dicarboxylate transport system permease small subunit
MAGGTAVKQFLNALFKGIEILIAIFLAVMITLMFMNVVLRYLFSKGFAWSEEVSRICFIYLTYLGAIVAARENRHLLIDSLLNRLPRAGAVIVYTLIQACIIWLMVTLTRGSWALVLQNRNDNWVATHFPTWLIWASGVITGVSIAVISASNLFRLFVKKEAVPDLIKARDEGDRPISVE